MAYLIWLQGKRQWLQK